MIGEWHHFGVVRVDSHIGARMSCVVGRGGCAPVEAELLGACAWSTHARLCPSSISDSAKELAYSNPRPGCSVAPACCPSAASRHAATSKEMSARRRLPSGPATLPSSPDEEDGEEERQPVVAMPVREGRRVVPPAASTG